MTRVEEAARTADDTLMICDTCGVEFDQLGDYSACPTCSALIAERCAPDPGFAAAVAVELDADPYEWEGESQAPEGESDLYALIGDDEFGMLTVSMDEGSATVDVVCHE